MDLSLSLGDPTFQRLIITLAILFAVFVLIRLVRRLVARYVADPARQYHIAKFTSRTLAFTAFIVIIALWSSSLGGLATILTVIGAGLAIAMREVLLNIVGGTYILFRKLFEQGDRIEVDGLKGDVVDIRLQHTTMMEVGGWVEAEQSTGRLVHIPNNLVFQKPVYNYTRGFHFIWNEIFVTVTFQSNWQAAQEIMHSLAQESADIVENQAKAELRRLSREYLIHYSIMTPFVYVSIVPNGVRLTLRHLCEVRKRRGITHALSMMILDTFNQRDDIQFAYPTFGVTPLSPLEVNAAVDMPPPPPIINPSEHPHPPHAQASSSAEAPPEPPSGGAPKSSTDKPKALPDEPGTG